MSFLSKILNLEYYISELDAFLVELDRKFPKPSESQQKEIKKYQRIYLLRDKANPKLPEPSLWENF